MAYSTAVGRGIGVAASKLLTGVPALGQETSDLGPQVDIVNEGASGVYIEHRCTMDEWSMHEFGE